MEVAGGLVLIKAEVDVNQPEELVEVNKMYDPRANYGYLIPAIIGLFFFAVIIYGRLQGSF